MRPAIPTNCPAPVRLLIEQCWTSHPEKRPDFSQIVQILEKFKTVLERDGTLDICQARSARRLMITRTGLLIGPKSSSIANLISLGRLLQNCCNYIQQLFPSELANPIGHRMYLQFFLCRVDTKKENHLFAFTVL